MAEAVLKAKITLNDSMFTSGMKKVAASANSAGRSIGKKMAGFITSPLTMAAGALAGLFSAAFFEKGIMGAMEAGASLKRMSAQTGMAVGQLSMLQDVFKESDVDAGNMAQSINRMQRNLIQAGSGAG